jgi:hypothetical protein
MNSQKKINKFIDLSTVVTGFSAFKLNGSGQVNEYYNTIVAIVGQDTMDDLLSAFETIKRDANDENLRDELLRARILSNEKFGPVTRNIIKMWFIGSWYKLSHDWRAKYGISDKDETHVVSANAYKEGLLWPTVGSHPPGAKAPGYGTWEKAPQIPLK